MSGRASSSLAVLKTSRATHARQSAAAILACSIGATTLARAADAPEINPKDAASFRLLSASPGGFGRLSVAIEFGDGLRFNNPYRLATELGDGAKNVSRTSTYLDLAAGYAYGPQRGLAHGFAVHLSLGLEGVKQQVVTPSYIAEWRGNGHAMFYGRFGTPIVLAPDGSMGFELAAGAAYFLTGRVAVAGEIVGDLFYGAGTPSRGTTTYPVLSGQFGLLFEQELLPW